EIIAKKMIFPLPINPGYAISRIDPCGTLGPATHSLAFVRWYDKADNRRSQFHCQIGNDDEKICNIELWKRDFYELSRDCIILIHSILGRFIAATMKISKKIP